MRATIPATMEVERVGDAGPAARAPGEEPAHPGDRHRHQRVEEDLEELHRHQVVGQGEHGRDEEVVERRDRPRPEPPVPVVAREDVVPRPRVLEDAERAVDVVVGVRVEERLVGHEQEDEPSDQGDGQRRKPPRGAAEGARAPGDHRHRGVIIPMPWKC
jgi:hypothetical protein